MRVTLRPWTLLFALLLVIPAVSFAQVDKATIEVVAVDDADAAVPGVTIVVTQSATGYQTTAVTGETGMARVPALPPGTYRVSFELSGFAPIVQEKVALLVGQTSKLHVTMKPMAEETITVTAAAPVVDVMKMDASTNISPEQIQELPVPSREFEKLAFIAPGVQRERGGFRFITNSPVVGSGGNASQMTIMVDGVDYTDQALGLSRVRFSQEAIREFRVINNRFDSEIANSQGGALSIVTRSGSNTIQGSVFGFYRGDELRTQGALESGEQSFSRYQTGFSIGGPITLDKTHYFASFEYVNEDNISLFRPLGAFASQARDVSHPFTQVLGLLSYTNQLSTSQNLQVKAVADQYREENFRVGGIADESSGMDLNRDNWNLNAGHTWLMSTGSMNNLNFQVGRKKFDEPNNSNLLSESFSSGNTLVTGANIVGDQTMAGDYIELRDTYHLFLTGKNSSHDIKVGVAAQRIDEEWHYPLLPTGQMVWVTDTRTLPFIYNFAVGDPDLAISTELYGLFVQDDWRMGRDLTLSLGVRYDYDTEGNNPDFTHPVEPEKREVDSDNIQPRLSFLWDIGGNGSSVLRGGSGKFTGRYLLVPSFVEQQQNGITGRTLYTRLNGALFGYPAAFWLSPTDPEHTGILLAPNIALLDASLEAPEAVQTSLGFTQRLGNTNVFADLEAVYVDGDNEIVIRDINWSGNATHVRPNKSYTMINEYTNEGRSRYKAVMASLNGTLRGGHLITASVTYQDRKNIMDDFSPALFEYPADSADIEAEWGRGRSDERVRAVLSGIFRLPWSVTVAPVYEYGSGQPWTRRLGYDYNGDLRFSDRAPGVKRNDEDGPDYNSLSMRITKAITMAGVGRLDLIVEGFNILNTKNYDVNFVNTAQYLDGPKVTNPAAAYVANPNFGKYMATLPPREIQLGLRWAF